MSYQPDIARTTTRLSGFNAGYSHAEWGLVRTGRSLFGENDLDRRAPVKHTSGDSRRFL